MPILTGPNNPPQDDVNKTTARVDLYANGDTGDDTNSGLTELTPKKTVQAMFDLLPEFAFHDAVLHLRGTFETTANTSTNFFNMKTTVAPYTLIEGGDDVVVLSGPHTSTAGETSTTGIGTAGLGLTPDQYAGYHLQILDGTLAGYRYLIPEHTADVLTPVKNFPSDPGAGVSYQIVRPATTISSTTFWNIWRFQTPSMPFVNLQNLYFTGPKTRLYCSGGSGLAFYGVIWDGDLIGLSEGIHIPGGVYQRDPDTFALDLTRPTGLGQRAGTMTVDAVPLGFSSLITYYTNLTITRTPVQFYLGSTVDGSLVLKDCPSMSGGLVNSPGYAQTKIKNATGVGLTLLAGSDIEMNGVDVSGCGSHGIEVDNSRLRMTGVVSGVSNVGAGIYAHANSFVSFPSGTAPTITGTVGDLSTDGTTEADEWIDINAGTPVVDTSEMTAVKGV